jgi:hypothetical protein
VCPAIHRSPLAALGQSDLPHRDQVDSIRLGRHGALSRHEAVARFGIHEVRRRRESGQWHAPWPGVVVDATRSTDVLTLASAAVLVAGPRSALAGPTAAYLHGCRSVQPLPVHVIVPYERAMRPRNGLVVHNGRGFEDDVEERHELPVICLERVVTDMLCRATPSDALAVTDEALAMVPPEARDAFRAAVGRRLRQRHDPRGTRRGARLLAVATGKAASPAESWFLCRVVDAGFPVPEVNWPLHGPDGREIYRLDFAWPELRIVIEYNGYAYHAGRDAEDETRAEDLRRRGWIVITTCADDLRKPARLEEVLVDAFRRRGVELGMRSRRTLEGRRHREPGRSRRRRTASHP